MSMHKGICGQCDGGGSIKPTYTNDVTLGDYITRKQQAAAFEEVKMTFDEWYEKSGWKKAHAETLSLDDADSSQYIMHKAWKAALIHGKL